MYNNKYISKELDADIYYACIKPSKLFFTLHWSLN